MGDDHGVSILGAAVHRSRVCTAHDLQCMQHGTTVLHWDPVTSHFAPVVLRLESDARLLSWTRPSWSSLRTTLAATTAVPDYAFTADSSRNFRGMTPALSARYQNSASYRVEEFEDGFVDLMTVKDFTVGCGPAIDVSGVAKLYATGRAAIERSRSCFSLLFGAAMTDNRSVTFVMPERVAGLWRRGLGRLVRAAHLHNKKCGDRRMHWLKDQYLQLYFEGGRCRGPSAADAIRVNSLQILFTFYYFVHCLLNNCLNFMLAL